jgi:hypothetical protein
MSTTTGTVATLRELMAEAIDYAGLFPPSSLQMSSSLRKYACYRSDPQSWALGSFVLPASRLEEFRGAQEQMIRREEEASDAPWPLSVVLSSSLAAELAAVQAFQSRCKRAVIDSIEARISQPEEMSFLARHAPADSKLFFEIAAERSEELLPFIGRGGYRAKLRMGGTVPEAFLCVETVAGFLARCAELGVALKATAGLHHPLRRVAPLTYEPNSVKATMHGFLNFFTAAAVAWQERQCAASQRCQAALLAMLSACLYDTEPANWQFTDDALTWTGGQAVVQLDRETLREARSKFALSFGSCSFEEPISELRMLEFM